MRIRGGRRLAAALSAVVAARVPWAPASWAGTHKHRPVIFMHGFSGPGAHFETQARRPTRNGCFEFFGNRGRRHPVHPPAGGHPARPRQARSLPRTAPPTP